MFSVLVFIFALMVDLRAETFPVSAYVKSAAVTSLSTPVAIFGAGLLTQGSNQLVAGLLPPVLFGIAIPGSAAYFSSNRFLEDMGYETSFSTKRYGSTIVAGIGTYASGTALGFSSDSWTDVATYSLLNALILPLPNILMHQSSKVAYNCHFQPSNDGMYFTGGIHAAF